MLDIIGNSDDSEGTKEVAGTVCVSTKFSFSFFNAYYFKICA